MNSFENSYTDETIKSGEFVKIGKDYGHNETSTTFKNTLSDVSVWSEKSQKLRETILLGLRKNQEN